jgi:hypothetical protein
LPHRFRSARIAVPAAILHHRRVVGRALQLVRVETDDESLDHARSHWARLVSRFLDMGEPMDGAMIAAARIVAFARTGPLQLDGEQETRRNAAPQSSIRRVR